ncbi:uncharacterized protein LOC123557489 [Mercenaria mercenaria]|uniref:uncharacterized protein LOC123557489 n=1 Tax=Mercenaria mercenaria TaxID=6596 RepID=UPI00234EE9C2|nr:uncharacterized protein LOC123557489 [Mercenaria mercenaria]
MMESENKDIFIGSPRSRGQSTFFSSSENIYKLKVVLIGDINVGKTSLAVRFSQDKFDEKYKQTIGASFISKIAIVKSDVIHFQIWDTAGQERYKSLVPMYLRGTHIAFVVYDITNPGSFEHTGFWLDALRHHCDMVTIVLVANKCDLQSVVDESMALTYAEEHGLQFVTVSAKTGYNVERLFHSIGSKVVDKLKSQTVTSVRDRSSRFCTNNQPVQAEKKDIETGPKKKKCCKT